MTLLKNDDEDELLLSSGSSNITLTPNNYEYRTCRYCLEYVDEDEKYCECKGYQGYIHYKCLAKWYQFNNYSITKCELCNSDFKIKVVNDVSINSVLTILLFILISILLVSIIIVFLYVIPYYIHDPFIKTKKYNAIKILILFYSCLMLYFNYINYKSKKKYILIHISSVR